jgi:acyl-homoserine-lactone acylase
MYFGITGTNKASLAFTLLLALTACSDSNNNSVPVEPEPPIEPSITYSADITWTEYGIPHIMAADFGSAGYGNGYAFANLNFCGLMREIVRANGQSARYFDDGGDITRDFLYTWLNTDERIDRIFIDEQRQEIQDLNAGYVAGVNRYLAETGVDNLPEGEEGCRSKSWVRPITVLDLGKLLHKLVLRASADPLRNPTFDATPAPSVTSRVDLAHPALQRNNASPEQLLAQLTDRSPEQLALHLELPRVQDMGSNGYGIGADASQSGRGLVLSNTHFPWQGNLRWAMSHVTIPGEYDVFGATLVGIPMPVLGVNRNLAWTHTVAKSGRFTFFELMLNPQNPLQYEYDGELRDIEAHPVTIERRLPDGSLEILEHTFYSSHYGPIVDLASFDPLVGGWPNALGTVMSYRDANFENLRGFDMWLGMGTANNMEEFVAATAILGNPWTNTVAADRHGEALYGDISVMPHVTQQLMDTCIRGFLAPIITSLGVITLDGSDSACQWGSDEGAPPGIFGYDNLPTFASRDYGANANNSYWVPNGQVRLEGFPPIMGGERIELDFRARQTMINAEKRKLGSDGLGAPGFNIDNLRELMVDNRNIAAEMMTDDLVGTCRDVTDWSPYSDNPEAAAQVCDILANWDRRYNLDSVGSHLFFEFFAKVYQLDNLYAVPFDSNNPLSTPRDLNVGDAALVEMLLYSLGDVVDELLADNIPLNVAWGDIQFSERNGERIGIHGGSGGFMFNAIYADRVADAGYSQNFSGSSFIMATTWDESGCPDVFAVLTYSQSTDPASPHFSDSTRLYSEKGWIDVPFCEADIAAQETSRIHIEE